MIELNGVEVDAVGGGLSFMDIVNYGKLLFEGGSAYFNLMSGIGGTLSNYYGPEMTLEIVAAGNMGA